MMDMNSFVWVSKRQQGFQGGAVFAQAYSQSFPEWKPGRDFSVVVNMDSKPFAGMRVFLEPEDD